MAATEYYYGTAGAQQFHNQNRPNPFPPQQAQPHYPYQQQPPTSSPQAQHYNSNPPYSGTPPPSYSLYPPQQHQPPQGYPAHLQPQHQQYPSSPGQGKPQTSAPYPQAPPPGSQKFNSKPQVQRQSGYLGVPVQPRRSISQPPRVHFEDELESDISDPSYDSDSDASRHRRNHRHRKHRHSHSGHRDRSSSRDRDYDYDREHRRERRRKEHKDRDTFLGAGAGGLIGDAIFPGLGTAAGLLLGGYGGRKHAQRSRSHSEAAMDREHSRRRHRGEDGWDEDSATYKWGWAKR